MEGCCVSVVYISIVSVVAVAVVCVVYAVVVAHRVIVVNSVAAHILVRWCEVLHIAA